MRRDIPLSRNQKLAITHNISEAEKLPHPKVEWTFEEANHSKSFHKRLVADDLVKSVRRKSDKPSVKVWKTKQSVWDYLKHKKGESRNQ